MAISAALAVNDIPKARSFYQKLGFKEKFTIKGKHEEAVACILEREESMLILGPVNDPHYYNKKRAEKITKGPRGLGMVLLITVSNLQETYDMVKKEGLEILLEPMDEFYGDRIFMFLDAFGYEWKIHQPIKAVDQKDIADALKPAGFDVEMSEEENEKTQAH
jgi:uncharacterized glyoxalase superfamily protein PhnB